MPVDKKFTPEPWFALNYCGYWSIQRDDFYSQDDILNDEIYSEAQYNAKLIAAAPELLEALQSCISLIAELEVTQATALDQAHEAIKKATK